MLANAAPGTGHMISLLLIYYLKYFLSISDIETILKPLNEKYFGKNDEVTMARVYDELIEKEAKMLDGIIDDITFKFDEAHTMYKDVKNGDEETLQTFAFITLLSQDVYIKKLLIEKLVDGCRERALMKCLLCAHLSGHLICSGEAKLQA